LLGDEATVDPLALLRDRALAPPSLRSDEPTGAPPLKPRRKGPFRGLRLRRGRESTPTARERPFPLIDTFHAPYAPYASLRDVPPRSSLRSFEGGLASERGSLPLTDARIFSAFHAGIENEDPDPDRFFSSGFRFAQAPWGAEQRGDLSRAAGEFLSCLGVRGGALPSRPSEAKEETISHFPQSCGRKVG